MSEQLQRYKVGMVKGKLDLVEAEDGPLFMVSAVNAVVARRIREIEMLKTALRDTVQQYKATEILNGALQAKIQRLESKR